MEVGKFKNLATITLDFTKRLKRNTNCFYVSISKDRRKTS